MHYYATLVSLEYGIWSEKKIQDFRMKSERGVGESGGKTYRSEIYAEHFLIVQTLEKFEN
jgi:hypothetical protein